MKNQDDKNKNPKIGRPLKTEKGLQFKKEYQYNQMKFQLQCELLVTIHEDYFIQPPLDPHNRRVDINYITTLFQKFECMKTYQVLLKLNEFYYKNSSIFPEDKLKYTSLIDLAYMFRQLKLNLGNKLRSIQLVLTIIFFLYNQKLINLNFYEDVEHRIEGIAKNMLVDPFKQRKKMDKIQVLFITLALQVASKQQIKLKK